MSLILKKQPDEIIEKINIADRFESNKGHIPVLFVFEKRN